VVVVVAAVERLLGDGGDKGKGQCNGACSNEPRIEQKKAERKGSAEVQQGGMKTTRVSSIIVSMKSI
jgi:hypothetical protein